MIAKFYDYFGVLGLLSVAAWTVAIVLMGVYARRKRQGYCLLVLVVAVVSVLLADANSTKISAIRLDQRDEMAAAQKAQRESAEAAGESGSAAPVLQFAEGDPEEAVPAYRQKGKQARTAKKKVDSQAPVLQSEEEKVEPERYMRQDDLMAANRLDRINLMIVRLMLLVAIGLVFWDYLAWFNATAESRWPLPVGGKWLDDLSRKTRAVLVRPGASPRMTPEAYAERIVRKGENILYFGDRDPWEGNAYPRFKVWKWTLWSLPKLAYGLPGTPQGSEFALDAAWFGRYGVVIADEGVSRTLLADVFDLLEELRDTGAAARKTVHLMLDLPQVPSADELRTLIRTAGDTNVKVVVWAHEPVTPEYARLFEEHFGPS
jgi:hypothetical protein